MRYGAKSEYILGISASNGRVEGALVQDGPDGPVLIRTFTRKRASADFMGNATSLDMELDAPASEADYSFAAAAGEQGDASLFLASEFETDSLPGAGGGDMGSAAQGAIPIDLELLEIMAECAEAGYENPRVVFTLGSEFVHSVRLDVPRDGVEGVKKKKKNRKSGDAPSRDELFALLEKTQTGRYSEAQTAFIPMVSPPDGGSANLAVFAQAFEPFMPSLKTIRNRKRSFPTVSLVETEISLLAGLMKAASASKDARAADGLSLLVRVGMDDTLVMFVSGGALLHVENLRSITAFDPPETICSRVLLLQDELGRSDAETIFLFSDDREEPLHESFSTFFETADIRLLRSLLPGRSATSEQEGKPLRREALLGVLGTLRLVKHGPFAGVFHPVDFLDHKFAGKGFELPISWPIAAMFVLLFGSTLFFVARYFDQSQDMARFQHELKNYPEDVISANLDDLEYRIDSLQARSQGFVGALDVLDSLLVGSDRWSRTLERLSVELSTVSGVWVEQWSESDGKLQLTGNATSREQIVALAASVDGQIESLTFSEIRERPVYTFVMQLEVERKLPEAALYLREQANNQKEI
ncbi:MAG: hypothetical protein RIE53_00540 [Rhodothermales bacterium]